MVYDPLSSRWRSRFLLLGFDTVFLWALISLIYAWRTGESGALLWARPAPWGFMAALILCVYVFGGFEIERLHRGRDAFLRMALATIAFGTFATLIVYLGLDVRAGLLGRGVLLGSLFVFFAVSGTVRWLCFQSIHRFRDKSTWVFAVSRRWQERLQADLRKNGFRGNVIFLDETMLKELPRYLRLEQAFVVIGLERGVFESHHDLFSRVLHARVEGHRVMDLSAFYERVWTKIPVDLIAPEWLIQAEGFSLFHAPLRMKLKRLFDVALAVFVLVATSPLMLVTAILIRLESEGEVLFRQVRTGKDGEPFTIFKFRTMRSDAEKDGARWAQVKDPRVTRVGSFLRRSRIDELPQVFNVLKGEMSFVGPRPERPEFNETLRQEVPFYELRHLVNPGITGWAQILYPYGASVEDAWEKLQYDLFYIKNHSLWLDLRIVLKTVRVVLLRLGR